MQYQWFLDSDFATQKHNLQYLGVLLILAKGCFFIFIVFLVKQVTAESCTNALVKSWEIPETYFKDGKIVYDFATQVISINLIVFCVLSTFVESQSSREP